MHTLDCIVVLEGRVDGAAVLLKLKLQLQDLAGRLVRTASSRTAAVVEVEVAVVGFEVAVAAVEVEVAVAGVEGQSNSEPCFDCD